MSGVIDKNVVQMVFDNVLFQENAQDTLSTLDNLKKALNFEGAVKGLEGLGDNVKNIGMDGLYNGVSKVQEGFSALDVIATRVLQNITDKVQGVVSQLANDALIQPLKDGFSEYELQMNSVQTIMSSTGESVGTVNAYLDELNEYADKTIYSFSDMTANIGKFTNAGVSLDRAVSAIQGVSNVAAISGANTNEASRAMYNFAQALSAGSVKLIDWKSIENANMATVGFKQSLIDTAVAMGTLTKVGDKYVSTTTDTRGKVSEAFNATSMFNDSLSAQWMTTDVLVQTLEQYSTDMRTLGDDEKVAYREKLKSIGYTDEQIESIITLGEKAADAAKDVKTFSQLIDTLKESLGSGWTKTWQLIFGDLNEAKRLWTDVNNVLSGFIDKVSDSRNEILETWHKSGYTYNEYGELVKAVYDENGKLDAELSTELVENGKKIRSEMGGRDFLIEGLRNTYQVFAEVMKEFGTAWQKYFVGIDNPAIEDISITGKKLVDLSRGFYDATEAMKAAWTQRNDQKEAVGLLGQLAESFVFFATSVRHGYDGIRDVFSGLGNIFKSFSHSNFFNIGTLDDAITAISTITGRIQDFGAAFKKHFGNDEAGLNRNGLITFFNALLSVFETDIWTKLSFFTSAFDAFGSVIEHLIAPFGTFSQILGKVGEKILEFTGAFEMMVWNEDVSKFEPFFKGLAAGLNQFIDTLKNTVDFSGFSKIFYNLIEVMTSKRIDLFKVFENVFGGLVDVFKAFLAVATPVAAALANIFGDAIYDGLRFVRELSDRFKSFTESLIANEEVIAGIQNLFEGIFSVLKAVGEVIANVLLAAWDSLAKIFSNFLPDSKSLGKNLTDMGEKLKGIADVISSLVTGEDGVPKLSDIIEKITDKFVNFFGSLKDVSLLEKFKTLLGKIGDGIKQALGGTEDMTLFDTIIEKIKGFLDGIKRILSDENGQLDFVKVLEAGGIGVLIKKLVEFFKNLKDNAGNLSGVLSFINDIKEALTGLSEAFQEKFKADSIKTIAASILEIAGALFIIAMIDPVALATAIATVKAMFVMIDELLVTLKGFSKSDAAVLASIAAVLQTLGNTVLMMAGAIAIIGNMKIENALQGVIALGIMLQSLVWVVKELSKVEKDIPKVAGALIALALAIDLLVIPVKVLGGMNLEELAKGLGSVAIMMAGLVIAASVLSNKAANMIQAGAGFVLMATGISILAGAVNKVSGLSWEDLGKGLTVFAVGLLGMVTAAASVEYLRLEKSLLALGGAMIMMGIAMNEFAIAGKIMAGVEWEDLGKMAAVFAVALVGLGIASYAINGANLLMIAGAIALVATAFLELNAALGLAQLVGPLMTSITMAIEGFSRSLESFAHSAARDAFLQFLKDAILFLPQLAVGLAQALIEMVVALGNGAAQIIGAVVNIGKAVLQGIRELLPEISSTILEFLVQIVELFVTFVTQEGPKFFEALTIFFDQLWAFLTGQIPNFFNWLTVLFGELFTFLQTNGPLLVETIRILIDTVLQAIITEAPRIGETISTLLQTLLNVIQTNIPKITGTLVMLILSLLNQLAAFVPQMTNAAMRIILGFLQGVSNNIGQITASAVSIAIAFMDGIAEKMPELVNSAFNLIVKWIDGLATAIDNNHDALWTAIGHLIQSIVDAILDGISKVVSAGGQLLSEFTSGLNAQNILTDVFNAGANLVQGFINGIGSLGTSLWTAACNVANSALSAIKQTTQEASPSKVTTKMGEYFTQGFINGVNNLASSAASSSAAMAFGAVSAFNKGIDSEKSSFSPSISPVFDDSKLAYNFDKFTDDFNVTMTGASEINSQLEASNQLKNQLADLLSSKNDYSSIINQMQVLHSDISKYNDSLSKLNIVLDSGELIGAITPEIDYVLGQRSGLANRGVY